MSPADAKRELRARLRAVVGAMDAGSRRAASGLIRAHLAASDAWRRAGVVMIYAADASEPDLDGLIGVGAGEGKTVCVARVDWARRAMSPASVRSPEDLVAGRHGIREPGTGCPEVPPDLVELVVVPGVGFDASGGRLGRGGGFYDRFLAERSVGGVGAGVVLIGACFAAQVVERVPRQAHDRPVDGLVTEAGLSMVVRDTEGPAT